MDKPKPGTNFAEETNDKAQEPSLCVSCQEFFGNPATEKLCSKCYRERNASQKKTDSQPVKLISFEETKVTDEVPPASNVQPEAPKEQIDHSKCSKCARKVGMLGYKCKCEMTYCKLHRLPEEHDCNFDFQTRDREKLMVANPLVRADKVQKF
eukprot:TRINITY_DN1506_c0_g3_i4.p1 TRINITY_DN1506_c0_g3~~TRINITY_DN1506_c0_g3_i4.p1  ORF type:complete len:153 (+),score=33.84 TRINITY_DN1506_c0_g3_i4:81-539(+)